MEAGLTPEIVTARMGAPREKHPASEEALAVWIYSQPEAIGTRTTREDVTVSPDGKSIPVYENEEVLGNVEYHLRWQHGYLISWERIAPKMKLN